MRARSIPPVVYAIAIAALLGPRAHALCAMQPPEPARLLRPVDHVARGSGIVVDLGTLEGAAAARLVIAGPPRAERTLVVTPIATQLAVITVPADAPLGRASLEGVLDAPITLDLVGDPLPPPLTTAPSATLHRIDTEGPRGRGSSTFEARLRSAASPGAIALVATWGTTSTWAGVGTDSTIRLAYTGRCSGRGSLASRGERVTLTWLDAQGRRSPPSPPIAVQ